MDGGDVLKTLAIFGIVGAILFLRVRAARGFWDFVDSRRARAQEKRDEREE